jgi:peptidoglycan/xylan/chitin deacetylase (PgdA/CDA1 family)
VPLHVLWFYPRNLPAIAHLSLDTDSNEPEKAEQMVAILDQNSVRATWCVILPGYERKLLARIAAEGHELAMHYDAMSEGRPWGEQEFNEQFTELTALFGGDKPRTNKNHYLRWEGDCELFDWCAVNGITFDQSKGASKTGEAGFNFGTCHPYMPVRFSGETIDVLELPTPTQDLSMFAPPELLIPLRAAALNHHGVMHLLFHPYHIVKPLVAARLEAAIKSAKEAGMEWWTAAELDKWERARRGISWIRTENSIGMRSIAEMRDATLLELSTGESDVERWGFHFRLRQVNISLGKPLMMDELFEI